MLHARAAGTVDRGIRIGEAAVEVAQQVAALRFGQMAGEALPRLGKDVAHAVQEPVDLALPAEEDAAQDQPEAAVRMRLRVRECECRAPRAAEHQPARECPAAAAASRGRRRDAASCCRAIRRAASSGRRRAGRTRRCDRRADRRSGGGAASCRRRDRRGGTRPGCRRDCPRSPSTWCAGRRARACLGHRARWAGAVRRGRCPWR